MKIFKDFDVYTFRYGYDDMKVMYMLSYEDTSNLDYEDLMRITTAVWDCWTDDEYWDVYPWMKPHGEEVTYIQAYANRVLPEFIKLYMQEIYYYE